jgi:putative endonuclease
MRRKMCPEQYLLGRMGISSGHMAAANMFAKLWIGAQEWALTRLDGFGTNAGRTRSTAPHLATGLRGERAAMFELRRRGMTVVARRWTSAKMRGDVDLIGWDGDCLCFIEVKTRTARDMSPAETGVDQTKRRMLRGLARIYLRTFPEPARKTILVRFDVISVYLIGPAAEFEFFQRAFGWQ